MVLNIWVRTCFQEELNKVEVDHVHPVACLVQGRLTLRKRYSVDVCAVFKKLFREDVSWVEEFKGSARKANF
jgi:hypothetical protein